MLVDKLKDESNIPMALRTKEVTASEKEEKQTQAAAFSILSLNAEGHDIATISLADNTDNEAVKALVSKKVLDSVRFNKGMYNFYNNIAKVIHTKEVAPISIRVIDDNIQAFLKDYISSQDFGLSNRTTLYRSLSLNDGNTNPANNAAKSQ